jgi:hypothetical protein
VTKRAKKMCAELIAAAAILLITAPAAIADYNANLVGTVASINTYLDGTLLFTLTNQPTSNGACNAAYFELDPASTSGDAAFNRMYARLAQAYATAEAASIGFDNSGGCGAWGYIRVYRIG